MNTKEKILKQLAENPILIYMKGVPSAPECGFSAKAAGILDKTSVPYAFIDVLKAPFIREKLPSVSKWPTFPQLFVNGQLVGGADIIEAMDGDGSLLPLLQKAAETLGASGPAELTKSEIEALILEQHPEAKIYIDGLGCDLTMAVISAAFAGQSLVVRHQSIMVCLAPLLTSGRLHAVTLKTHTPDEWLAQQPATPAEKLLQIQL